jgi:hypothetical protein
MHDSTFLTLLPVVLLVVLSLTVAVYHYTGPEMTGEGFLNESTQPSDDICTCNRGKPMSCLDLLDEGMKVSESNATSKVKNVILLVLRWQDC